jgi:hypothetical protein
VSTVHAADQGGIGGTMLLRKKRRESPGAQAILAAFLAGRGK